MQATRIRRVRNAAPSTLGRQSTPGVAAARRTAKGHCARAGVWVGVACGARRARVSCGGGPSGGGYLHYYWRVHVHRGDPILAHDGAGLVLQSRDASVEHSGKHKREGGTATFRAAL